MIIARFKRVLGFMNNPVLEGGPLEARMSGCTFFFETDDGNSYRFFAAYLNADGFSMAEWTPFSEKIRKQVHEALMVPLSNDDFDEYINCREVPCVLKIDELSGIVCGFFTAEHTTGPAPKPFLIFNPFN